MKNLPWILLGVLALVLGACKTSTAGTEAAESGARPEVRYYVIADT